MRAAAAFLAMLGGCALIPDRLSLSDLVPAALRPSRALDEGGGLGVPSLPLANGDVTARGPDGYCVDTVASNPVNGFAVLASCTLISDIPAAPAIPGLVTIQLGQPGSAAITGAETALERLLRTEDGARLLSAEGRAQTLTLDTVDTRPGIVTVHFTDTASPVVYGTETTEWRAFFDLGDRLTTVGVRGFERDPLDRDTGRVLLDQALAALRAANADDAADAHATAR